MAGFGAKVKLSVDHSTAARQKFNDQINSLVKQIKISNKSNKFVVLQKDMDRVRTSAQTMLNKSPIKITNIDCSQAVTKLRKDLQNVINSLSIKNGVSITGLLDPTGVGDLKTEITDVTAAIADGQDKVDQFNARMSVLKDTMKSLASVYQNALPGKSNGITDGALTAQLDGLIVKYNNLKAKIEAVNSSQKVHDPAYIESLQREAIELQASIAALQQKQIELAKEATQKEKNEAKTKELTVGTQEFNNAIKQTTELLVRVRKAQSDWTSAQTGSTREDYMKLETYASALQELLNDLNKGTLTVDEFKKRLSSLNSSFTQTSANIKDAGKNTKTLSERIGTLAQKFGTWLSISQVIMLAVRSIKKMVSAVIEVDTAMTELRKVTNETEATYDKFLNNATVRAKKLGATISDTVNASADFARLGYTLDESAALADAALVYKNVGDGIEDINNASASIISTMRAFGVEAENAMFIVDKFNEIGNNFAISSKGVGDALLRSASALAAGNNTLDESIALITAANSSVQDADVVGTTMKTVSMYLRAAKTEAEEAGESTDGMANSVSKLREEILALTGNKVDIQIDENNFKSTYQIIKELAGVWGELTDISQANILEMIGGKRNANVVMSLIENFEIAENVITSAAGAAGSALAENEKYLDSIAGKVSTFKTTFEELSVTLINSEFVKGIVDFGTGLLNVLNAVAKLIDSIGGLNTVLMGTAGIIAAIKLDSLIKLISVTLPAAFMKLIKPLTTVVTAAIQGTSKFSTALKALGISASAAQLAIGALTVGITTAIAIYQHRQQTLAKQKDAAIDAADALNEVSASVDAYKSRITELRKAIDYGNLSEQEAYNKRQELIDIEKSLVEMFGKEAEGIDLVTGSIDAQIDAIDRLSEAEWNAYRQENTGAIKDAISLLTDFNPKKLDWWGANANGSIQIQAVSTGDLWDAIKDLSLDIRPADFHDALKKELENADLGIEIPIAGVTGDFGSQINAKSIYDYLAAYQKLYDITEKLGKEYFGENYLDYIGSDLAQYSTQITKLKSAIKDNEGIFNYYVKGLLNYDAQYSIVWGKILAAQKEYQDAILNGDGSAAETALIAMQEAEAAFLNAGWDNAAVNLYVKEFFDSWNALIGQYEFKVQVKAELENDGSSMGTLIKNAVKYFKDENGTVDLYRILNVGIAYDNSPRKNNHHAALTAEEQAYVNLKYAADNYGASVEELINLLVELGIVESTISETGSNSADNVSSLVTKYKSIISVLRFAFDEFKSGGFVASETYNRVIALNKDYANLFDFTNGKIELQTDNLKELANSLMNEYGALIAANGATEEQIRALQIYGSSLTAIVQKSSVTTSTLKSLVDILRNVQNGTSYSTLAMLDLIEQYPELTGHIIETANGYTIEEKAIKSIVAEKAKELTINEALIKSQARLNLIKNANNPKTADTVDEIFQKYGNTISSFKDYVTAWEDYFGKKVDGNWVNGLEDYVNASIAEAERLAEINNLLEGLYNPDDYKYGADDDDKNDKDIETEFERQLRYHQHLVAMEKETDAEYLNWLSSAYQNAFRDGQIELSDFYNYQEEVYNKTKNLFSDYLSNNEHRISMLEYDGADAEEIIKIYERMLAAVAKQIETYRNLGLSDNSDYIQELQKQLWDYENTIKDVKQNVIDDLLNMVSESSAAIDEIQGVYDTLKNAAQELADNGGYLSVDSFQAIVELGTEYMQYLRDENGLLVINEENINRVIAAKTQQLALDNAMSYVERLRIALQGDSIEDLNHLLFATTEATDSTWKLVYANLALLDLNSDQYEAALRNINTIRALADNAANSVSYLNSGAIEAAKQANEQLKDELNNMKNGSDDFLNYVMDMLKHRIQDQINALKDLKDSYADLIELKKKSLEETKKESDYQNTVVEKVKDIAKLQEKINLLSLDDSRDAQAQRAKLEEDLAELQKDLSNTQADYAYDAQVDSLDKMQDAYESEKDSEIAALEESISSTQKLYDMAIDYIESNWSTLKNELITWNYEVGNSLESELVSAWESAYAAAQRYGSFVSALGGISADIDAASTESSTTTGSFATTVGSSLSTGNTIKYDGASNEDMIRAIVARMNGFAAQWDASDSKGTNDTLHSQAAAMATKLDQYGVHAEYKPANGTWTITKDDLNPSNIGKLLYECYHQGGIVGGVTNLKENEVMAILEKGEAVLDGQKEKGLYKLIDFISLLSKKIGSVFDPFDFNSISDRLKRNHESISSKLPDNITNHKESKIHFGDVYIYGGNEETIRKHTEVSRNFVNEVLEKLNIKK